MKRIIVITLLLTPALLASAATPSTSHKKLSLLEVGVTRAVAKQQATPAWKAQLKQMQQLFRQYPGSAYSGLPVVHNEVLGPHQEELYLKRLMQLKQSIKGNKFINRIIESPLTKKAAGVFGAGLAFFVLVTGVNKAFKTGTVAYGDIKYQLDELKS